MSRPTILTFVHHYLPGYRSGGPVRTVANMADQLGDDLDFRIVTADRDALSTESYPAVDVDAWNKVGRAYVFYASPRSRQLRTFARLMRETPHDVLYLNSFHDPVFTLRPLLARSLGLVSTRPTVIAPRGEFSEGALELKAWKKGPYRLLAKASGLYRGVTWQASSENEAEDIRRAFGRIARQILVAPNLSSPIGAADLEAPTTMSDGPLRIVLLSRIARKKNIDFALRVLGKVSVPVQVDIYGPVYEQGYWHECQACIRTLPPHVSAQYHGSVQPEAVPDVLRAHDLFMFPTRGENFGHTILEALAVGTPVLTSDRTPWVEDGHGGCTVRSLDDEAGFVAAIERFAGLDVQERMRARTAAYSIAKGFSQNQQLRERNLALFRDAQTAQGRRV